jgi:hypothetical protein
LLPDFIANCGMARVFAYLMSNDLGHLDDNAIFNDSSDTIKKGLEEIYHIHQGQTQITASAFDIALKKLNA